MSLSLDLHLRIRYLQLIIFLCVSNDVRRKSRHWKMSGRQRRNRGNLDAFLTAFRAREFAMVFEGGKKCNSNKETIFIDAFQLANRLVILLQ